MCLGQRSSRIFLSPNDLPGALDERALPRKMKNISRKIGVSARSDPQSALAIGCDFEAPAANTVDPVCRVVFGAIDNKNSLATEPFDL